MLSPPAGSSPRVRLVPPPEEADLVARCQAQEPAAFRALFERERLRLHRLLYHLVGSNTHIDDLLQDAFLEVFRSLPGFRGESSLRTWIDRCVVRVAYAHFGRRARQPVLEAVQDQTSEATGPEERTLRREAVRRLYAELDRLEPQQRTAFVLFAIQGISLREVAAIMNSSVATAKIRTWRARRALEHRAKKDPLLSEFLEPSSDEEVPR